MHVLIRLYMVLINDLNLQIEKMKVSSQFDMKANYSCFSSLVNISIHWLIQWE